MRLTALVESPDHVCCRYRLAAFQPHLERAGYQLQFRPWPRTCWSRLRLGRALQDCDAVILQRKLLPNWQLYLLRTSTRMLVFDFDDAVFQRDSYALRGPDSPRRLLAFAAMAQTADALVAGNSFLADQAARWAPPGRVQVIPTCVDPQRYPLAAHQRAGRDVNLVWIGSSSTLRGLELVQPLLEVLGRRCPGVRLKLVCDRFLEAPPLTVVPCPWSEEGEADALAASDIGISWLPDDSWSRGKCGLKVLQYMAAGLPVVANPVGVQAEMVRHGETGFLVRTAEEWVEAINRLANDPELRRRFGQAGRQRVEAEFSVAAGAARWVMLLEGFRRGGRQAA